MAHVHHAPHLAETEEALTVLFCLIDDAYALLNPRARRYASLKRLADSEVITLALFQQLRGVESERSFLRDAQRFFAFHLAWMNFWQYGKSFSKASQVLGHLSLSHRARNS
jgi:hypothetical protein